MKKRTILLLFVVFISLAASAQKQYVTSFTITDLNNSRLESSIEATMTALVSELNQAHAEKRTPKLQSINATEQTKESISMMWENSPFRCLEPEIVESASKMYSSNEYEIRNIPFTFTDFEDDDQYHEAAVTFNSSGVITSFHMVISQNLYSKVMKSNNTVKDLRRRQMILDYVEQFRTAYNTKDLNFLNQIFSDDALIITGRVITPRKRSLEAGSMIQNPRIEYTRQSKQEYLTKLKGIFARNKRIRVMFDDIKVVMHPTDADWYGVTLRQGYSTDNYHDDGYLFLLWDFSDENAPVIHVRTWQPEKIGDHDLTEDEIFGIEDCNINH